MHILILGVLIYFSYFCINQSINFNIVAYETYTDYFWDPFGFAFILQG